MRERKINRRRAAEWNVAHFARSRQLLEAQQNLATAFTIDSLTSDWSAPVEIKPPVEFYVVRASEDGGSMGLGEIRIEMYRYFDGSRRSEQFSVQPGEQIGRTATVTDSGTPTTVDFSTNWYPRSAFGRGQNKSQVPFS